MKHNLILRQMFNRKSYTYSYLLAGTGFDSRATQPGESKIDGHSSTRESAMWPHILF